MLQELVVAQPVEEESRRWFSDSDLDLIVWFQGDVLTGFQLCYDKTTGEHALTWTQSGGFEHSSVDSGEQNPLKNLTPILVADGIVPLDRLISTFTAASADVPVSIRDFVLDRLAQFV